MPDIFVPIARGAYHGMYIEMKAGRNTTTQAQKRIMKLLEEQGYYCVVCYFAGEALEKLGDYLRIRLI